MSNTYTKIYLHFVFAVKNRESLLPSSIHSRLFNYINSVLRDSGHYLVAIGGIDNHIHLLIDFDPKYSISDTVRELKVSSTKFINSNHLINFRFAWQRGYSCFSHSPSQIETVKNYIIHQYDHHRNRTFAQEIQRYCLLAGIDFDERYLLEDV